ncbi:hypothetical protein [Sphingobium sp. YR768]|uniref:hypothetical protein n=1 Tax=Sphingobium sp. YR768 TaxID=1884365 RepID=UPI0008C73972|nr:hypothetical protein [Sphingobium sp. YR768]SES08018.1 hypothetical protein SAMN05518866_13711 [Sphingobium sp. YR768]
MPRSDFATSAEYHADAAVRAADLIQTTVARIDAAISKLENNRHRCGPFTFDAVRDELMCNRRNYLGRADQVQADGSYLCGYLGPNGRLAKVDTLIEQVERISKAPVYVAYVPPVLRDAGRAAA